MDIKGISPKALESLLVYHWPGNIRELENVIEHAFVIETTETLCMESLPEHFQEEGAVDMFGTLGSPETAADIEDQISDDAMSDEQIEAALD